MERITSRKNPKIQYWRKLASSGALRREAGETVCDGAKLYEEAVKAGLEITAVIAADGTDVPGVPEEAVTRLPEDLMEYVSPMKAPQGLLFTCRIPEREIPADGSRFAVLEGVQDPGNVGTVLRAADAFEADGVLLLPGCADPWAPKTVRASMGAIFRRPVWQCTAEELGGLVKRSGLKLYGAALRDDTADARTVSYDGAVIAIGSEGRGLSETVLKLCDATVRIPMSRRCESLNAAVAAAILLWEAYR